MTKFQKQMLTIAAAGALTAVTALPAMAFENEFHGMMAVKTFYGNFDNAGLQTAKKTYKTDNYTEQRTRIQYTAKASDDLKLVTHFEMNTKWGDAASGGDIDTDGSNLVVKHAYLDFNMGKSLNMKLGQLAYKDLIGGLYVDADLPMALATYKAGSYTLGLGYSRFQDTAATAEFKGDLAADLYAVENTFALNKDTKLGLAYYLNADNSVANTAKKINTFGLFGQTKMGGLDLSAFAAMQAGYKNTLGVRTSYHGWAANVLAKMKLGSGNMRTGVLFTSGNNKTGGHNGGWQTLSASSATAPYGTGAVQNSYNQSGMMLLVRNTSMGGTSTDNYFRKPITNIALAHVGYDAKLTDKMYLNGNVGFAWVPASNELKPGTYVAKPNGGDFMGTEINLEAGYKLYKNLTLKAQAATVILGGAYKKVAVDAAGAPADPTMPWTTRLGAHYSF